MGQDTLFLYTPFGIVRDARSSDTDSIVQLVGKLAAHHEDDATLTSENLARDAFGEKPWIYILVAEADGELIGYSVLCNLIQLQFGVRGLDMHHLFTEEGFRGRGIGTALVDACKTKAKALSCRYLMVGTHPDNNEAQVFYENLGFMRRDGHPPRFSLRLED
jgi:GNAT superfamily N-acetyltransferase